MRSGFVGPTPTTPPPGRVDEALSLLAHAAFPLDPPRIHAALMYLRLPTPGLSGGANGRPASRRHICVATGLSPGAIFGELAAEFRSTVTDLGIPSI